MGFKAKFDQNSFRKYSVAIAEAKGEIRGEAIGARKKAIAIAQELKKIGLSVTDISKITGLAPKEIETFYTEAQ